MSRSDQATVGTRTDTHTSDSLYGLVDSLSDHAHSPCDCWPVLGDGIPVEAGAVAWNLSAGFIEIAAANDIAVPFDIHFISIEGLDTVGVYLLELYAVEAFIGRVRFTKTANLEGTQNVPFQTIILPANVQIQAKLADSAGGSIATIALGFHPY